MKISLDVNDPVAVKIASSLMTKAFRDKFNLHSQDMGKGLVEESKRQGITPQAAFKFLNATLPVIVAEFLKEVGQCQDRDGKRLNDAS